MLPPLLQSLRLPVIASPMLIASYPELVLAQCKAGIVGAFPALNARPAAQLDDWLVHIDEALATHRAAHPGEPIGPYAVNQICHQSNGRLEADMRICLDRHVPLLITSLRAPPREIVDEVHRYGGLIIHDVTTIRHAEKALEAGVDGLILVAAGAGGHAGTLSPFALVSEVRRMHDGLLVLSGAIANGDAIAAAVALGADAAYIGTRFLASHEANVVEGYKQTIVEAHAGDIIYTDAFTGVHGNYLRQSIEAAGLDPRNLPRAEGAAIDFSGDGGVKQWRDIWGAGQGVGAIDAVLGAGEIVAQLEREFHAARARLQRAATPVRDDAVGTALAGASLPSPSLPSPVAFLGPSGSYTEEAMRTRVALSDETLACESIDEIFAALADGRARAAVVPIENSSEGAVVRTVDRLLDTHTSITGEIVIPVSHCLLSTQPELASIDTVIAHPHALAQCRQWLVTHLPHARLEEASSNSAAVRRCANVRGSAAIAGERSAAQYGLRIAARSIHDRADNRTRFLILGGAAPRPTGHDRTSLVVRLAHSVGSLARVFDAIALCGVSVLWLEPRPLRGESWAYWFFIDVAGHRDEPPVAAALDALSAVAEEVYVLGAYPRDEAPASAAPLPSPETEAVPC